MAHEVFTPWRHFRWFRWLQRRTVYLELDSCPGYVLTCWQQFRLHAAHSKQGGE